MNTTLLETGADVPALALFTDFIALRLGVI